MSKKKGPITAAELAKQLQNDPEYQARMKIKEEKQAEKRIKLIEEQSELALDLKSIGLNVDSVWDLVNAKYRYPAAIPILIRHLDRGYSDKTMEGIIRSLAVAEARNGACDHLILLFEQVENDNLRWVIGNTIGVAASEADLTSVCRLLDNEAYHEARSGLVKALARLLGQGSVERLERLLDDGHQQVVVEAMTELSKLKAIHTREKIAQFLTHEDSWVREKTRQALKKLDKS